MIKTLTLTEFLCLRKILIPYLEHMEKFKKSRLCKFFGLYSITLYSHTQYLAVMNNIYYTSGLYKIDEKYDLKGSRIRKLKLESRRKEKNRK